MLFVLSLAWSVIIAWLILRAVRQDKALMRLACADAPRVAPKVAVVVPARDEADNIASCVTALVAQAYPPECLHIVVVDDHSTDATPAIVRAIARNDPRLTLALSPTLPPGWTGKAHACWVGAEAAAHTEWLCFIDADVRAEPALLASAVQKVIGSELDFLSLSPRQELKSFAERVVMPCGFYLLAFCQDLDRVQALDSGDVTATGQCMLVRREIYERVGGHAAVRDAICEDLELARRVKQQGGTVALFGGDGLLATRMYTGWRTLWLGVSKNLVDMLGGPLRTILTALAVVVLAWAAVLLPLVGLGACRADGGSACVAFGLAFAGSAAAFAFHVVGASFFAIPLWYGLLFPLGYTAGALMALDSVRRRATGRVIWKGRVYS